MTDEVAGSAPTGNPDTTSTVVSPVTTTAAVVAATPAPPAPAVTGAIPWLKDADEPTVGYVQNKGWTEPAQVLQGYRHLETMLGADKAGRTVVMPGEKAEAAEFDAFYNKLGRPADAKDYKVDMPDGSPPEYADGFRGKAHELGLTSKQVEGLAEWNNKFASDVSANQSNQSAEAFNRDTTSLKTEWGAAHDQNVLLARQAAQSLGWDGPKIDKISGAIGHAELMKTLQQIGAKTGESDFVSGKSTNYGTAKSPAQAKAEISALRNDKEFTAKLLNKDADANSRWTQLHQYAYPS
jgi:hypothetical protein